MALATRQSGRAASAGGDELTTENVVLAGGSRPLIPDPIDGTDEVAFLTSAEALRTPSNETSVSVADDR